MSAVMANSFSKEVRPSYGRRDLKSSTVTSKHWDLWDPWVPQVP